MSLEVDSVLLCDAASVREGLLHVLGGGITRLWRPELPSQMAIQVAVIVSVEIEDFGRPHDISIQIFDPQGTDIAGARGGFIPNDPGRVESGEAVLFPMVFDFRNYPVVKYGAHDLKVTLVGSGTEKIRRFWVLHPDELALPTIQPD